MYAGLIHTLRYAPLAGNPAAIPRARLEASFTVMYRTFVAELTEAARFGTGSEMRALLDRLEARVQLGRQDDAATAAPAASLATASVAAIMPRRATEEGATGRSFRNGTGRWTARAPPTRRRASSGSRPSSSG